MTTAAPPEAQAAILGSNSQITRRVEIYETDLTPWKLDVGLIEGSVSASAGGSERRTFDLVLDNADRSIDNYPGGFWYDKVIKIFRGVEWRGGSWETQLGEFVIDNISQPHFPDVIKVSGRDYTKKLMLSKFNQSTDFDAAAGGGVNDTPEKVIRTIALNGGITKFNLPVTGQSMTGITSFAKGVERWVAIKDLAEAFGYDLYFSVFGELTMTPLVDPVTSPESWVFKTGVDGNLVSYEKSSSDTRIYNSIVVTGGATNKGNVAPYFGLAKNENPTSPTRIAELGERVYEYHNPNFTSNTQAQATAEKFLAVHALEQFELSLGSIVIPWLDVNTVVEFVDPKYIQGQPTRFLLTDLSIPLGLGPMGGSAKRVTIVG